MLGARGATGADTSGGALALILRVGANTDDARRKMKALDDTVTKSARWQMKQFRTAFTTFFSVSAIRTLVYQSLQYAKNFENVRHEVNKLGIEFDESVIKNMQVAEVQWRSFMHQMRIGIATLIHEMGALRMGPQDIAGYVSKGLGFWGHQHYNLKGQSWRWKRQPELGEAWWKDVVSGGFHKGRGSSYWERQRNRREILSEGYPKAMGYMDNVDERTEQLKKDAAAFSKEEQRRIKLGKLATGGGASSFQQASLVESKDALTKFGLFRGQHGQDVMLSVVKQQLSELVSIQLNTEPLKRGII